MSWLVSVDPGVNCLGVAMWYESELIVAGIYTESELRDQHPLFADLAIELPQVYRPSLMKGRASDLINLAVVVGRVEAMFKQGEVTKYLPKQWKGQIPKPKRKGQSYAVAERCKARLTWEELQQINFTSRWRQDLDIWDAIGIGLRHLKNTKVRV